MTSKEAFNELKRETSVRGNLSTFQKRCFDIIQQDLDRLEQLEKENQELREKAIAWDIIKQYLIVEENRIDEDSYYECIVLKNDAISELGDEIEGIHVSELKKVLGVKNND